MTENNALVCPFCNEGIESDMKFCPNCGKRLIESGVRVYTWNKPSDNTGLPKPGEGNDILVNVYYGTTPAREAVGMGSTYELVLSRYPDGRLQLDEFIRASSRVAEKRRTWFVSPEAEKAAYDVIDMYGLDRFEGQTGIFALMTGGEPKVCKFRRGDRLIRITESNVDEKSIRVFDGVRAALSSFLVDGAEETNEG